MKGERFELITLRSGTRAIRELHSGEIMHPSVGPWAEARQLYVEQTGLAERLQRDLDEPVRLYDVGLGGAANACAALTTLRELGPAARRGLEIDSFEIDTEPLALALAEPEGFPFLVPWSDALRALLAEGRYEADGIRWRLHQGDVLVSLPSAALGPELIFHDPFSPEVNTSLWTPEAFAQLRERSRTDEVGTTLVTYSASTRTRVSMLLGGFYVGIGAPTGHKRETTAASTRRSLLQQPLDARWLSRWERSSSREPWGAELTAASEAAIRMHPQFA